MKPILYSTVKAKSLDVDPKSQNLIFKPTSLPEKARVLNTIVSLHNNLKDISILNKKKYYHKYSTTYTINHERTIRIETTTIRHNKKQKKITINTIIRSTNAFLAHNLHLTIHYSNKKDIDRLYFLFKLNKQSPELFNTLKPYIKTMEN
jgi:hypothetical protein